MTQSFTEVFNSLPPPFILGAVPQQFNGTLFKPEKNFLVLSVFKNGKVTKVIKSDFPKNAEVTSGFNPGDFACQLEKITAIAQTKLPLFPSMTQSYTECGSSFMTSTDVIVMSIGESQVGFFDLVVVGKAGNGPISHVYFSELTSALLSHSGDSIVNGCLIHLVTLLPTESYDGVVVLVGYNDTPLTKWHGKSVGLFVIDQLNTKATFVPLDLASTAVVNHTGIIPIYFRKENNSIKWIVKPTMKNLDTAVRNTYTNDIVVEELANIKHLYSNHNDVVKVIKEDIAPVEDQLIHTESIESIDNFEPFELAYNDDVPPLIISNVKQFLLDVQRSGSEVATGVNSVVLALHRSLEMLKKDSNITDLEDPVPFLFPTQTLENRVVSLAKSGISSAELAQKHFRITKDFQNFSCHRSVVFHLDENLGFDSSFMKSRKKGSVVVRLNCVFIVHVSSVEKFPRANMSVVSFYAGPQATIVYKVNEKYYLNWATPMSVIPKTMNEQVNPEWVDFPELLKNYLERDIHDRDCQVNKIRNVVQMDDNKIHNFPIAIPGEISQISFNSLQHELEKLNDQKISPTLKLEVINSLKGFEYILEQEDISKMQALIRKTMTVSMSQAEKLALLKQIHDGKRISAEEKIEFATANKEIERLTNIFESRKYIVVNEFLAKMQEKKAQHGAKAAMKLDMGHRCQTFAESGDIASVLDEDTNPHYDEFLLFGIDITKMKAIITTVDAALEVQNNQKGIKQLETSLRLKDSPDKDISEHLTSLTSINSRMTTIDSLTLECMLSLGLPHSFSCQSSPFAVPINDSYVTTSLIFLPLFKQLKPNLTEFENSVMSYILVEGIKTCSSITREIKKLQSRSLEYSIIYMLLSLMEFFYNQRASTVEPGTYDVNDTLIIKIRSCYYMIRGIMMKNVSLLTPEPIMQVLETGKANNVIELDIAIRLIKFMDKTGLEKESCAYAASPFVANVVEVFLRAIYTPYEKNFQLLLKEHDELVRDNSKALTGFYAKSKICTIDQVKPRIRPKKCTQCELMKTIHEFPRKFMHLVVGDGEELIRRLDFDICLPCHGYDLHESQFVCPRENCGFIGSCLDFPAYSKKKPLLFTLCYSCLQDTKEKAAVHHKQNKSPAPKQNTPKRRFPRHRSVPPMYKQHFFATSSNATKSDSRAVKGCSTAVEGKKEPNHVLMLFQRKDKRAPSAHLANFSIGDSVIDFATFVRLGMCLGVFSETTEEKRLKFEILNIVKLMINNFKLSPPWKAITQQVQNDDHKKRVEVIKALT